MSTHASPRGRAATIQDVARVAGVSRAAVSKVLRDAYGVSDDMRERVRTAIEQLDYRPRVAARAMRGSSFTIGIQIPQVENEFFSQIVSGAIAGMEGTGYQLIAAHVSSLARASEAIESLADRQVDGIVVIAPLLAPGWLENLALSMPVVMIGRHAEAEEYDAVTGRDSAGTDLVMDHLLTLGHTLITHLTVSPELMTGATDPHMRRLERYRERMAAAGLAEHVLLTGIDEEAAYATTRQLISSDDRPRALFAGNDTLAMGALRAAAEADLPPERLSIVGYDGIAVAAHPRVMLTTVNQHGFELGANAIRLMIERIEGRREPRRVDLLPTLEVRHSTAPPLW